MAEPRDTSVFNEPSRRDPAEGARENIDTGDRVNTNTSEESGTSNRPIEEEQREQQTLPPRGESKDGAHA